MQPLTDDCWRFIERFHPDYSGSGDIFLSNLYSKYLEEPEEMDPNDIQEFVGNRTRQEIIDLIDQLDHQIFYEALDDFLSLHYESDLAPSFLEELPTGYWNFIMDYLPDYDCRDDVRMSDLYTKYFTQIGDIEPSDFEKHFAGRSDDDIYAAYLNHDLSLLYEAITNYLSLHNQP